MSHTAQETKIGIRRARLGGMGELSKWAEDLLEYIDWHDREGRIEFEDYANVRNGRTRDTWLAWIAAHPYPEAFKARPELATPDSEAEMRWHDEHAPNGALVVRRALDALKRAEGDLVRAAWRDGATVRDIAAQTGASAGNIRRYLKHARRALPSHDPAKIEQKANKNAKILALHQAGYPLRYIAKECGASKSTVDRAIKAGR